MVNPERTKLMAKAELFREKEARKALSIDKFSKIDYMTYELIRSGIVFIIGCMIIVFMYVLYHAEALLTRKTVDELIEMAILIGLVILCLTVLFLVAAFFVFRARYKQAAVMVKQYREILKEINTLYEEETVKVWRESEEYRV